MLKIKYLLSIVIALSLTGCASKLRLPEHDQAPTATKIQQSPIKIQYLGVGGHRIQYGEDVLLTGPSFTNPHLLRTGPFMPLSSNHKEVDKYMPESSNAEIMLIGHAHYDHLLDVPYVMQKYAPKAHLYGSKTTVNTIINEIPAERMTALNDYMGTREQPGKWFYSESGTMRIMGLKSSHAPHFMGIKLMQGKHKNPLKKLPWHAFKWKEGQTLAFVIDFLDADKQPVYRLFYQDSASEEVNGVVPDLGDGKGFDVAIICAPSFNQVDNYPESIVQNTLAKHYILGHWEDFFGNNPGGKQKFVRNTNQNAFIKRMNATLPEGSHWTLPQILETYQFNSEGLIK